MGWNWRSLTPEKLEFTKFLISKYNPDATIIWETWLNKIIKFYPTDYELYQTDVYLHQGVWIIVRKGLATKIWRNNEQYFITIQLRETNPVVVIGAYFRFELRMKILFQIKQIIERIRKAYNNPNILLFCDLNPGGKVDLIEKELNLKISTINSSLVTRKQKV